jgi:hypothetical protein
VPESSASGVEAELDGYIKNFFVVYRLPDYQLRLTGSSNELLGSVTQRLRLNLRLRTTHNLRGDISYDLLPRIQDHALYSRNLLLARPGPVVYRVDDLDRLVYPDSIEAVGSFAVFQNLDRLQIVWSPPPFDLYVGRQAIAWGSARIVNPTDVLVPFEYTDLDVEDRVGVDAIRLRMPLGSLSELDAGYLPGRDFEFDNSALFLRGKFSKQPWDLSLLLLEFRRHLLLGLDVTHPIGGAGAWLELAYVWLDTFAEELTNQAAPPADSTYLRISTGVDYQLTPKLYGYLEYHFNGAGSNDAGDGLSLVTSKPYTEGAVWLTGKHYLAPGILYQFSGLWSGGLNVLANLSDPSMLVSPVVEYNLAENVYLEAGAFVAVGKPVISDALGNPIPIPTFEVQSEFGLYSDLYYLSFSFYF